MNQNLPDLQNFKDKIFQKKNVLGQLLAFSLKLMEARQAGLIFGTDSTCLPFLPPEKWDRGVMHKFQGRGVEGIFLKIFGKTFVTLKKISPVLLYQTNPFGEKVETKGVISYVLRHHQDFYKKGIKILMIENLIENKMDNGMDNKICAQDFGLDPDHEPGLSHFPVVAYDGLFFNFLSNIKVNTDIVRQFKSQNFIAAYIPDYGAIVFNTVDQELISKKNNCFSREADLRQRLNILISAIESASLAYLGFVKGKPAVQVIWRKERELRKTFDHLKEKEGQLDEQKKYLRAAGGVTSEQLNMVPLSIPDGVYAFIDMVGSATIREGLPPRDFFLVLNLCHEIAAKTAGRFACRVDNFMGDAVFFQNVSIFDDPKQAHSPGSGERIMLMTCMLASFFNGIRLLKQGRHSLDRERRVAALIKNKGIDLQFRAGLEQGAALIGPLGSRKRKIVTAIGKAVDTASRLESCGIKDQIHITGPLLTLLENLMVTQDTAVLCKIAVEEKNAQWARARPYMPFFEFYKNLFDLSDKVIQKRDPVAYKEFSDKTTYVIQCIPDVSMPSVCPGI
jgi:class 3 adenylate cyclase